jgi:hypothetical protein
MSAPMGRVKNAIYARMEEMRFRSGAALAAGVLAAAVVAIVLAVTLSGHSVAATGAQGPGTAASPAPSPTRSPAASSSRRPASSPAASLAPVAAYQPPAPTSAAAPSRPVVWPDGARWHHRFWRAHHHRGWPGWG